MVVFAASCRSTKPATKSTGNLPAYNNTSARVSNNTDGPLAAGASKRVYKRTSGTIAQSAEMMATRNLYLNYSGNIENCTWLQFKYAVSLDVPVEALNNLNLFSYIDEWFGVPYRYGGSTKTGIDCSAFSAALMNVVFGTAVPRTVKEQYLACRLIDKSELQEGDLVFFNTTGNLSHVGLYLVNNKFVHASTTGGVMISDLNEDYYSRRFAGAGRIR